MPDQVTATPGLLVEAAEGRKISRVLDTVSRWAVYALALLVPLFYLPFTSEGLELPKQILLIVLTLVGVVAWLGRMLVTRKAEFRMTVLSLLIGVYLVVYAISTWASKSRYVSLVGDYGQEKAGLITVVCFALVFFLAVNVLRGAKDVRRVLTFVLAAGFVAVVQAFLQALGLRVLPGAAAQAGEFNLVGTSNALGIYAAAILVVVMGSLLAHFEGRWGFVKYWLLGVLAALAIFYVASLQFWSIWAVVAVGSLALVAYGMVKADKVKRITMLSLPMAAVVLGLVFSFVQFPIGLGAPAEVMPSFQAGWDISRESLVAAPLLGSGPGTFLYDYAQFRSPSLNATNFWDVHFDRSSSRLLTLLATTGILGIAAYAVLFGYLALVAILRLRKSHEEWWLTGLTVFAAWVALGFGKLVYSSNLTLEFMFWLMTALLVVLFWPKVSSYKFESSPRASLTLSFLFIVAVILSISGLYLVGQRYAGEIAYTHGLNRDLTKVTDVDASINDFVRAVQLNAKSDLYARVLSQAYSLRANLEVQKIGMGKPTSDQSQQITLLASNAVAAGKAATDLNPQNVENWSSLASLYRDLVGSIPGADEAAVAAYQKAIVLEPNGPDHLTDLGRVYLAMAQAAQPDPASKDEAAKATAQKTVADDLTKAKENFDKALAAKADYSPARYWLALTLSQQGQTKDAISNLETVLTQNSSDLNVGFQLGILYYQDGQKDKAVALLERVTQIQPNYSNAQWYLAAMYEDAGRIDDAIARVQAVLKNNPDNDSVKQRLTDLQAQKSGLAPAAPTAAPLPPPVEPANAGQVINTQPKK
jgi:tetratricopeptide (TPR) repeat protein